MRYKLATLALTFLASLAIGAKAEEPVYNNNMDDVVEVLQKEYAITNAEDEKPVLAASGLYACTALVGYDKETKVGFLAHYDLGTDVGVSFDNLAGELGQGNYEVNIIGGENGFSEELVQSIRAEVNENDNMIIVQEDVLGHGHIYPNDRSIALDTRTGEIFTYDPGLNPNARQDHDLELILAADFMPAVLHYSPELQQDI